MQNLIEILKIINGRRGLRRVWTTTCDGNRKSLVSRWINGESAILERQDSDDASAEDAMEPWPGICVRFVC
jgi:hypothetical protein